MGPTETATTTEIRLLTWNIRKGKGTRGNGAPMEAIAAAIARHRCHVVFCQEVFDPSSPHRAAQSEDLARRLAMTAAYGPNAARRRGRHGNATLTRLRLAGAANFDLTTNRLERRGVLYTRLEMPDTELHLFNTHLGLNAVQRRKQVRRIATLIEELVPEGDPLVLAGDFNDWTGRIHRWIVRRCGVRCALDRLSRAGRRSWPSRLPIFGLDRVYVRHLRPARVQILRGGPFGELSDHLPVLVTLRLPTGRCTGEYDLRTASSENR